MKNRALEKSAPSTSYELGHLQAVRRAGAKYLGCAFSWNGIEKEQGKYKWAFWDGLVAAFGQNRIGLIPYVAYTPQWAARDAKDFWKHHLGVCQCAQ